MRRPALAMTLLLTFALENPALTVAPALAAGEDRAMALDLFEQGRTLLKSGDTAAALIQFEAAAKLMRTFGILLNIAECQETLGRTASAWATWSEARAVASEAQRSEDERMATERQKALEGRLSRLTIKVSPEVDVPDLEVRRDGTVLPREGWGRAIAVDPGSHVIEAHAPGRKSRTVTVLVRGDSDDRSVTLPALEADAAPIVMATVVSSPAPVPRATTPPATSPIGRDAASASSGQRLAGWVLGGFGLATAGTGIAIALIGQSQHNDAVTTDREGHLAQAQTMESKANTTKTIGYIAIGAAGAFVLTGLVLVLAAPADPRSANASGLRSATVSLGPWASAKAGGAIVSTEW